MLPGQLSREGERTRDYTPTSHDWHESKYAPPYYIEQDCASDHDDLKAWLFMAIGGEEPEFMISDMYEMASTLRGRNYPSLEIVTHFFPGENYVRYSRIYQSGFESSFC